MEVNAVRWGQKELTRNIIKIPRDLIIKNIGAISKEHAVEMELWKNEYLNSLTLIWTCLRSPEHNEREVLQALHPPTNIKYVRLEGYPGEYLPSWFRGSDNNNGGTVFGSLIELSIEGRQNLSSLEQFLQPTYVPAIRKITITDCTSIKSVPTKWSFLEELYVWRCPSITHLLAPSIKKLDLQYSGTLGGNINCSSLTIFHLSGDHLASIELKKWSLPVLQELEINRCRSLKFIRGSEHVNTDLSLGWARARHSTGRFPLLTHLAIKQCDKLESLDDLLTLECLPAIESITIRACKLLISLPTERLGSFSFLKNLDIDACPRLHWQSGMVLPPSLQTLFLWSCGDFSALFPRFLENLSCIESLVMGLCNGIVSIPGNLWSSNLKSLEKLAIVACPDLVSIGGLEAIANINTLCIGYCPKLKEIEQPRGNRWW